MSGIVEWVKEYVSLFLAFTLVLYVIPSNEYRGYLRFFLEMVLVLFCLRPLLETTHLNLQEQWEDTYHSLYEEMEKREEEAMEMVFLDDGYIKTLLEHSEEEQ